MFFFRHPKSIIDPRPVAVKIVQQQGGSEVDRHVLMVEKKDPLENTLAPVSDVKKAGAIDKK